MKAADQARGLASVLAAARAADPDPEDALILEAIDDVPFVQIPHWVPLAIAAMTEPTAATKAGAIALYNFLAMHLSMTRGDRYVWPTRDTLAALMGYSRADKISPFVNLLVAIDALVIIKIRNGSGPEHRNVYRLRRNPPAGYTGHVLMSQVYSAAEDALSAEEEGKTAGRAVHPDMGVHVDPESGADVRPDMGSVTTSTSNKKKTDDAPSARSARGVRSTSSTGSSARAQGSGSAASGKAGSSTGEAGQTGVPPQRGGGAVELTREQLAAVHAVEAGLPSELKLPFGHIPNRNRAAVLAALESRTPEQLAARAARRWVDWRYVVAFHDGELRSHIAVALELIAPTPYCPDLACEDGHMIDTKAECTRCVQRIADRRRDRLAGRPVRTGKTARQEAAPECVDCGRPFPGAVPADGVCKRCHDEAAAACAAFAAQAVRTDADREAEAADAEALEQEAQRRRALRTAEAPPVVEDVDQEQAAAEDEESRRLQAEILAANPWMAQHAAPETAAALQGPAPF